MFTQWLDRTAPTAGASRAAPHATATTAIRHHRLPSQDDDDNEAIAMTDSRHESPAAASSLPLPASTASTEEQQQGQSVSLPLAGEAAAPSSPSTVLSPIPTTGGNPQANLEVLSRLEEERDELRQRSGVCVFFALFLLVRLWLEAVTTGNFLLLALASSGTALFVRYMQYNQARDDDLSQQMTEMERSVTTAPPALSASAPRVRLRQDPESGIWMTTDPNGSVPTDHARELRRLSYQAQLAWAILESQRHIMTTGGYGHPDGEANTPGVSQESQQQWKRFAYQPDLERGNDDLKKNDCDLPHCSICLGEHEENETLVQLPCGHDFHEECITSWTSNHTKCPLCNFDLEAEVV
jgi:Ring finger domain